MDPSSAECHRCPGSIRSISTRRGRSASTSRSTSLRDRWSPPERYPALDEGIPDVVQGHRDRRQPPGWAPGFPACRIAATSRDEAGVLSSDVAFTTSPTTGNVKVNLAPRPGLRRFRPGSAPRALPLCPLQMARPSPDPSTSRCTPRVTVDSRKLAEQFRPDCSGGMPMALGPVTEIATWTPSLQRAPHPDGRGLGGVSGPRWKAGCPVPVRYASCQRSPRAGRSR